MFQLNYATHRVYLSNKFLFSFRDARINSGDSVQKAQDKALDYFARCAM